MGKLTLSTGPFSIAMLNYQRLRIETQKHIRVKKIHQHNMFHVVWFVSLGEQVGPLWTWGTGLVAQPLQVEIHAAEKCWSMQLKQPLHFMCKFQGWFVSRNHVHLASILNYVCSICELIQTNCQEYEWVLPV